MSKFCLGFDMYHGDPDWDNKEAMAQGLSYVYLKIGQGTGLDSKFVERYDQAESDGITKGAYFYYDTNHTPKEQAQFCLDNLKLKTHDLPFALDIESNSGNLSQADLAHQIHTWLLDVEKGCGRKPIIYTSPGFWNDAVPYNSAIFLGQNYELWLAHYTQATQPKLPQGWNKWTLWQYAPAEEIDGCVRDLQLSNGAYVDSNRFLGTHADLVKHFGLH